MAYESSDEKLARELEELRARLAAAHREDDQRREALEQLRADFHRLSEQLRQQRLQRRS
jgi:hypothetical protein